MAVCLSVLLGLSGIAMAEGGSDLPASEINWDDELQSVDGFGGSFAFHKAGSIQRLEEPLRSEMLDKIFDQDTGIGLDIARVMVGDGGIDEWGDDIYDGPTETIMPEPGELVWDQEDWEEQKDDFDAYQIWLMQEAQERGVDTFMASVWSPPAWMKENESVTAGGPPGTQNRLRDDMYQEFADYLAEYVLGYEEHFGIEITHLSPTNEPDFSAGYSSSRWTPEELNEFVGDYLGPTFDERGVEAEIVLGEAIRFDETWVVPSLQDPDTRPYVDVVAAHAYTGLTQGRTAPQQDAFELSNELGKRIWQTEYMNQGAPRDRDFEFNLIGDGLRYATLIANMYDITNLNAYFWWWPVSNSGADGSNLIRLQTDGPPQNLPETGEYRTFKRYYTFGQYSRFLDDEYVMIAADKEPLDGVVVTAYKNPGTDDFTIVAVNNNEEAVAVGFDLAGDFALPPEDKDDCKRGGWREFRNPEFRNQGQCVSYVASGRGIPAAVVPYRTSANENMRKLDDLPVKDSSYSAELRGQSVTTFIPKTHELPELPDEKDVFSTYVAAENDGQSDGLEVREDEERGEVLTNVTAGDFIRYDNVNFADGSAAGWLDQQGELAMHGHVSSIEGGVIEVRLGDPEEGSLVGTMDVPSAEEAGTEWSTVSTEIDTNPEDGAYGFHDMYLVFQAPDDEGGDEQLFDVDYFEFSDLGALD